MIFQYPRPNGRLAYLKLSTYQEEISFIEMSVHLNMELFLLQCVNPIDIIDLYLEHGSFLSKYGLEEEILGKYKLRVLSVILLANSSLNVRTLEVKYELLTSTTEARHELEANSIEIAWQQLVAQ